MSSLARREDLAGKVQMIYIDPPYGIKFASNFHPEIGKRDVKDKETDLTREPEMVKAYRDTWQLGIHSYLSCLRDRLERATEIISWQRIYLNSPAAVTRIRMDESSVSRSAGRKTSLAQSKRRSLLVSLAYSSRCGLRRR
ncbi:MAG TPA: hypothetical protein VKV17_01330 [Bryobacteraceae bacterium]|nr:hypothetical protein [Bryobacteraceae bacterium]